MTKTAPPPRGFPDAEFEARTERAQAMMTERGIDALLLSTEPEVRYFSGFLTPFWQSPTRPWFLIVPRTGKPVAVIPAIGAAVMARTWVTDIRTWDSPIPADEGVSLLKDALLETLGNNGVVGIPKGPESHLRMPLNDFERLSASLDGTQFVDASPIVETLRMTKSELEIDKVRYICQALSDVFENLPDFVHTGMTEVEIFRDFRKQALDAGADEVPYLVGGVGAGGVEDIISPPTERRADTGDLLMLDTGAVFDGYFCDFDRNYAFGDADEAAKRAYDTVFRATDAGLEAARPGATSADVFHAMNKVLEAGGAEGNDVGRMGHGLGMQLTEWPSNAGHDQTILVPGMVLTLEPGMNFAGNKVMVHEENLVIRDGAPELLSRRACSELPIIGGG